MQDSFKQWLHDNDFKFPWPGTKESSREIELANFGWVRVDAFLYPLLSQFEWFATAYDSSCKRFVASRRERLPNGRYKSFYMHSQIVRRYVETVPCRFRWPLPPDVIVEFKNGCSLDCVMSNLKFVTKREHIDLLAIRKLGTKRND